MWGMTSSSSSSNPFNPQRPANIPQYTGEEHCADRAQQIHFGTDLGGLIASIPTLLGFPPSESLIAIGLSPRDMDSPSRLKVGPLVRIDIGDPTIDDMADAIADNACAPTMDSDLSYGKAAVGQVILVAVAADSDTANHSLQIAIDALHSRGVSTVLAVYTPTIATGEPWIDVLSGDTGTIGNVESNPVRDIATLNRARVMQDREEMEQWLDSSEPLAELAATQSILHRLIPPETADVACVIGVSEALGRIEAGECSAEDMVRDQVVVSQLVRACLDADLHTYIVACSAGHHSAAMRDLLAECVRRGSGPIRRRMMVILALVLTVNDEGTLAFHTLGRVCEELLMAAATDSCPDFGCDGQHARNPIDAASIDMAELAFAAHRAGFAKKLINLIIAQALELIHHMKVDLEIIDDLATDSDEPPFHRCGFRDFVAIAQSYRDTSWPEAELPHRDGALVLPVLSHESFCEELVHDIAPAVWPDVYTRLHQAVDDFDWERINSALNGTDLPGPA